MKNEVIFIYLGNNFPKYGNSSLSLANKYSGLQVRLIASENLKSKIRAKNFEFTSIESFYSGKSFHQIKSKALLPSEFRNGFWLKTLERFFVLYEYMKHFQIERVFHAELDQLLFNCNELLNSLDNLNFKGISLPFDNPNKAVASIFYCNHIKYLKSFLDFVKSETSFSNEMYLFAEWAKFNKEKIRLLPTLASEVRVNAYQSWNDLIFFSRNEIGGICDAAQVGQWVGGEDPRNVPIQIMPKNKYCEPQTEFNLNKDEFSNLFLNFTKDRQLFAKFSNFTNIKIFNLHLHSKIHNWINKSESNLEKFIEISNNFEPAKLPSTRRVQVKSYLAVALSSFRKNPCEVMKKNLHYLKHKT